MSHLLSEADRRTVLETLGEIRASPAPRSWAGPGWVMALPGFVLLLVVPLLGKKLALPSGLATLLLCHAWATHGPSTVEAFDFTAARARVGDRLELVTAVERVLLAEGPVYPVFTLDEEGGQA